MKTTTNGKNLGLATERTAIVIDKKNVYFNIVEFDGSNHTIELDNEMSYRMVIDYLKDHYNVWIIWDGTKLSEVRFMGMMYFKNHCVGLHIDFDDESLGTDRLESNSKRFCESARNLLAAELREYIEDSIKEYWEDEENVMMEVAKMGGEWLTTKEEAEKELDDIFWEAKGKITAAIEDKDFESYKDGIAEGIRKLYEGLEAFYKSGRELLDVTGEWTGCNMVPGDFFGDEESIATFKNGMMDLDIFDGPDLNTYFWWTLRDMFENTDEEYHNLKDTLYHYLAA